MRSFRHQTENRRAIYLQLAGSIESQLRQAYAKRHDLDRITQTQIADQLGVNRSAVNRRLTGGSNMTTETIADMVWALGHCIKVEIFDPSETPTNGTTIVPVPPQENPFKGYTGSAASVTTVSAEKRVLTNV